MLKRPMLCFFFAVILGSLLSEFGIKACAVVFACYFLTLALSIFLSKKTNKILDYFVRPNKYGIFKIFLIMIPVLFLSSGVRSNFYFKESEEKNLPYKIMYENKEEYVSVFGTVYKIRYDTEKYHVYLKDVSVCGYNENVWRNAGGVLIYVTDTDEFNIYAGNKIKVYGKIYYTEEPQNPGEYDGTTGVAKTNKYASIIAKRIDVISDKKDVFLCFINNIHMRFAKSLINIYDEDTAGVLIAMITGDREMLTDNIKETYKDAGISHILAISGLHISLVGFFVFNIFKKLSLKRNVGIGVSCVLVTLYVLFSGAADSAVRAGIMFIVMMLSKIIRRKYDILSSLSFSGIVILFVWPTELKNVSFLLSFMAIIGVYAATRLNAGVFFGAVVTVITLPVTLWYFFETNPWSFFANIIVIPLTGYLMCFGIVAGITGMIFAQLGNFLAGPAYVILFIIEKLSNIISGLPFSKILVGRPAIITIILFYTAVYVSFCFFLKRKYILIPVCMAEIIFLCSGAFLNPANCNFLSVGQGDSFCYLSKKDTVLLDSGSLSESNVGSYAISSFLKCNGKILIDKAIVTHMDSDHMNGITELLENMNAYESDFLYKVYYDGNVGIKELIMPEVAFASEEYEELVALAREKNVKVTYLGMGNEFYLNDGTSFKCIWPEKAESSENDTSLVFLIKTDAEILFMAADIGADVEQEIVSNKEILNYIYESRKSRNLILKVSHHGSKYSTCEEFVSALRPDTAVISCAYINSYGHPGQRVIDVLTKYGAEIKKTYSDGAISY